MKDLSPKIRGDADKTEDVAMPIVLYVEDNADNRQSAEVNLGKKFELLFAVNDREACNILALMGKKIAVILMDIELRDSELNGIELTKLVRGLSTRERLPDYAQGIPISRCRSFSSQPTDRPTTENRYYRLEEMIYWRSPSTSWS